MAMDDHDEHDGHDNAHEDHGHEDDTVDGQNPA